MNLNFQAKAISFFVSVRQWAFLLAIALFTTRCKSTRSLAISPSGPTSPYYHQPSPFLGWNLLFAPGTSASQRAQSIASTETFIQNAITLICPTCVPRFQINVCACDSNLVNLNFTTVPVGGTGQSVTPPPGNYPPTGGSGNPLAGITLNIQLEPEQDAKDTSNPNYVPVPVIPPNPLDTGGRILGILDTGLDPSLIPWIRFYLWKSPNGETLYNFLENPSTNRSTLVDDHPQSHGTVATALALKAIPPGHPYPRIMVLKVLDSLKKGSTFSVSCGMSYAIQNHATVINASLGYYPTDLIHTDTIMEHYIKLAGAATPDPIIVVAAAGNTPTFFPHDPSQLCVPAPTPNQLTPTNLFLPACDAPNISNVITVTGIGNQLGLSTPQNACQYQNYSGQFISVGVINNRNCCKYSVSFKQFFYEGSSFATPVFSGFLMDQIISHQLLIHNLNFLPGITLQSSGLNNATKEGRFILNPSE